MADGKHYESDEPGLVRRHVETVMISYTDDPPTDIREERGRDIFTALSLGFAVMDRNLLAAERRAAVRDDEERDWQTFGKED
jgi:hypothetical protein